MTLGSEVSLLIDALGQQRELSGKSLFPMLAFWMQLIRESISTCVGGDY
jgi:hypothetical protein